MYCESFIVHQLLIRCLSSTQALHQPLRLGDLEPTDSKAFARCTILLPHLVMSLTVLLHSYLVICQANTRNSCDTPASSPLKGDVACKTC